MQAVVTARKAELQPAIDGYIAVLQSPSNFMRSMREAAQQDPEAAAQAFIDSALEDLATGEFNGYGQYNDDTLIEGLSRLFKRTQVAIGQGERGGGRRQ